MQRMAEWMIGGDITAFFWMNRSWRCSFSDYLMPLVTNLGGAVWCISLSLVLLLSDDWFWHQTGVRLALSLISGHLAVAFCKKLMPRPRPYQVLKDVCTGRKLLKDASFPSGHATAAFSMATVLSTALPAFLLLFYCLALLIACSRVYLGLHYPSDVAAGAVLGTAVAWLFA